jgi:hypothetical protein
VQVVPSYLEVVLSYLEAHPRALPDLRCVSVTGEALKKELVQRWFAAQPGIALVNAYGLTETSDDTNHAVLRAVPDTDRVPLGRPIANVEVRVVDEHLVPVPLGAPGEIVFSGVCVGRGYVNDPERTRRPSCPTRTAPAGGSTAAVTPALAARRGAGVPRPPGQPGEDLRLPHRDRRGREHPAAGAGRGDGAWWSPRARPQPAPASPSTAGPDRDPRSTSCGSGWPRHCRRTWSRGLPPARRLPLTPNGKIDTKALTALGPRARHRRGGPRRPRTPTEAPGWPALVRGAGIPQSRSARRDSFFDRGRDVAVGGEAGRSLWTATVSPPDLLRHARLADLAALLDERTGASAPSPRTPEESAR